MAEHQQRASNIAFPPKGIEKPKMYISDGKKSYFDRFAAQGGRYREATPEEDVRQTFVSFLRRDVRVPNDMLKTEDAVAHYVRLGRGRVDIIGLAKQDVPLFVVECKRLGLPLDDDVKRQAVNYAKKLEARFAMLTNGNELKAYQIGSGERELLLSIMPSYSEMLEDQSLAMPVHVPWVRPPWPELQRMSMEEINRDQRLQGCLGESTPSGAARLAIELAGLLLDESETPECWSARGMAMYPMGIGHVTPRNPSGGIGWEGRYRQWRVPQGANNRLVSVAVMGMSENGKTMLLVGTDQNGRTGNALQLALDDFVNLEGDEARIHHNGRMRGGVTGASNAAMIAHLRSEAPHLLGQEGNVDLGALPMNRRLEWPDARRLIFRCAEYALARESFMHGLTESTENVN